MTDKELRKLTRAELLEMLIAQGREVEQLRQEIERLNAELTDRHIAIEQSGTLAEAAMKLSGIFEAAQTAADLYLANVTGQTDVPAKQDGGTADEEEKRG